MKEWLVVRKSDSRIVGWQRSGKATDVPPGDAEKDHVEADLQAYFAAEKALRDSGRDVEIYWQGGALVVAQDQRPRARITFSKGEVNADGQDTVDMTVTALNAQGNTATGFNATRKVTLFGRRLKLTFVNGVAVKTLRFTESGLHSLASNNEIQLETPASLDVVE